MAAPTQDQDQLELTDLEDSSGFPSGSNSLSHGSSHDTNGAVSNSTGSSATSSDKSRKSSVKSSVSSPSSHQSKVPPHAGATTGMLSSDTDSSVMDPGGFGQSHKELLALERLDDKSIQLQQEGRYTEALECMEKALVLRQHFFGADSDEVWNCCKTVGELCNLLAMTFLQQEEFAITLQLLRKAEVLTEKHPQGKAVTLNNLACYHRRQGNLHKALTYLNQAIEIESKLDNIANRADTHLNMCAVLSQLGKHQGALDHAQAALILLHEELFSTPNGTSNGGGGNPGKANSTVKSPQPEDSTSGNNLMENKLDRVAVLGIAYHNVGVEQEFLKRYDASLLSYQKGVELTKKYLGETHGIVLTLQNSLVTAKESIKSRIRTDKSGDGITKVSKQMAKFLKLKNPLSKSFKTNISNSTNSLTKHKAKPRIATEG